MSTGTGGANVPINLSCTKTPTITVTGASFVHWEDIHVADFMGGPVASFPYGHDILVEVEEKGPFNITCPATSTNPGTHAASGSADTWHASCSFSSIAVDATVAVG